MELLSFIASALLILVATVLFMGIKDNEITEPKKVLIAVLFILGVLALVIL